MKIKNYHKRRTVLALQKLWQKKYTQPKICNNPVPKEKDPNKQKPMKLSRNINELPPSNNTLRHSKQTAAPNIAPDEEDKQGLWAPL